MMLTAGLPAVAQPTILPGKYYEYYIVARTGAGFTDLGSGGGPSINDVRQVAFRGSTSSGNALWYGTGQVTPVNFNPGESFGSSDTIQPSVQINSNQRVVSEDRISTTNPATTSIRLYNANADDSYSYAARGGPNKTYSAVFANPAVNLNGDVVYTAQYSSQAPVKVLGLLPAGSTTPVEKPIRAGYPQPMIADDGTVVVAVGGTAGQSNYQILVYPPGLQSPVVIADTNANWTSLDLVPGISRDGIVVAFQGNPTNAGASAIGTTVGPGIFVAVNEGLGFGSAKIIRLTGVEVEDVKADKAAAKGNLDGVCDTAEICTPAAELGWDRSGKKITLASYGSGTRVGVAHLDFGGPGINDDTFVVSFIATPSQASRDNPYLPGTPLLFSAQQGLWTIRVDVQLQLVSPYDRVYHQSSPIPVVQIGDRLGSDTITGIAVYDPIANAAHDEDDKIRTMRRGDHRMAFWASTNNGQIIVRGNHLDSDQDGLLDHWETTGIDVDQDGVVDLVPSDYGADPFTRDLFVQVDHVAGSRFQVQPRVFNNDIPGTYSYFEANYRNAEALSGPMYGVRIDGLPPADIKAGIVPHVDAGPGPDLIGLSPSINLNGMTPVGGKAISMPGYVGLEPDVVYFGVPESINIPNLNTLSFEDVKDTYFGKNDKDAHEFVFHYVVLAQYQDLEPNVTLGLGDPANPFVGTVAQEAGYANYLDYSGTLPAAITAGMPLKMTSGGDMGVTKSITGIGTDPITGSPALSFEDAFPESPAAGDRFVVLDNHTGLAEVYFLAKGAASNGDNNSLPGNDVIVSIGAMAFTADGVYGTSCEQWQTIMHELGHNLGLRHGGTDHNAYKGNAYLSIMSYSWDLECTPPLHVTTYAHFNDPTYPDSGYMRMDFQNIMFHMGNSLGLDLGSSVFGEQVSNDPEPTHELYVSHNGPLDTTPPSVSITSPAANSTVNGSLTVNITATDNVAVDSVSVLFDVNANGVADLGDGVVATSLGGNHYQAVFNGISGANGLRPLTVIAYDKTSNFTRDIINVDVGGIPLAMVPNVIGLTQAAATTAITNVGLTVGTLTQQASSTIAAGDVASEIPAGGTVVNPGSVVNLVISTGAALAISSPSWLPVGTVGVAYLSSTITASGGSGTYSNWSVTGLPAGLSLDSASGIISGTPSTNTGSPFSVTVTVTDSKSATVSRVYNLRINTVAACQVANQGNVSVSDVQYILQEALGAGAGTNELNGDGAINVADVQIIINAVLNLGCWAN